MESKQHYAYKQDASVELLLLFVWYGIGKIQISWLYCTWSLHQNRSSEHNMSVSSFILWTVSVWYMLTVRSVGQAGQKLHLQCSLVSPSSAPVLPSVLSRDSEQRGDTQWWEVNTASHVPPHRLHLYGRGSTDLSSWTGYTQVYQNGTSDILVSVLIAVHVHGRHV